jgi:hypothetical protein
MEAAPNLEIIPTAIDGSWRVFQRNMFPVPYGATVQVRFGESIPRARGESPTEVLERCRMWIEETIGEWRSGDGQA